MRSQTISTRVSIDAYQHLCNYCLEKGIGISDILIEGLKLWQEKPNTPDYLKNALQSERADIILKVKMKRILFLHNVQQKLRKLYIVEHLDFSDTVRVIIPLLESFVENAKAKGYDKEYEFLKDMLENARQGLIEHGNIEKWKRFSIWSGCVGAMNRG